MAKRKNNYLNNKDLLAEFIKSKEQGQMTKKFELMMIMLVERVSKHKYFVGFTWNDQLKSEAILTVCKVWHKFDPSMQTPPNPFAYFTQIIKRAMMQQNYKEQKQTQIRDALLVEQGLDPSYNYTDNINAMESDED